MHWISISAGNLDASLALIALLCAPLAIAFAHATGDPIISTGYDNTVHFKAAVKFSNFNTSPSSGWPEVSFGMPVSPAGKIDFQGNVNCETTTSISGSWLMNNSNPFTINYNPLTGKLHVTVQASKYFCKEIDLGDVGPLNYIKLEVNNGSNGPTIALNNLSMDGISLGSFPGIKNTDQDWNVFGLTFTEGFTISGNVWLSKSQPATDTNYIQVLVGHYDQLGPITSNVSIAPSPVYLNGLASISAEVDDSTTYGSDIASAEFNLDDGLWAGWNAMFAQDGAFDGVFENVQADFTADQIGKHTTCVRGTDNFIVPNTGEETCHDFIVTYVFDGFFEPIEIDSEIVNNAKAGQAIPTVWRLTDALGVPIDNPASFAGFYTYPISCDELNGLLVDSVEEYAAGDSGLQYLGDGYWQYNWKTLKSYSGSCRAMYVLFDSGTTSVVVPFKFK